MKEFIENNWISLLALLISLIALFKDMIKDLIAYKNRKRDLKKAEIKISHINKKLIISNHGKAPARNIKIFINDKPIEENYHFNVYASRMDFSILTSNNSLGISYVQDFNMDTSYKVKVIYDDNLKNNNEVEDIINVL